MHVCIPYHMYRDYKVPLVVIRKNTSPQPSPTKKTLHPHIQTIPYNQTSSSLPLASVAHANLQLSIHDPSLPHLNPKRASSPLHQKRAQNNSISGPVVSNSWAISLIKRSLILTIFKFWCAGKGCFLEAKESGVVRLWNRGNDDRSLVYKIFNEHEKLRWVQWSGVDLELE